MAVGAPIPPVKAPLGIAAANQCGLTFFRGFFLFADKSAEKSGNIFSKEEPHCCKACDEPLQQKAPYPRVYVSPYHGAKVALRAFPAREREEKLAFLWDWLFGG